MAGWPQHEVSWLAAVGTMGHPERGRARIARVDPVGELALGDELGVYRQRIAPSRLKSTTRRLVKRRVDGLDNTQAFRASRRSTASRSPRTLIASAK